MEYYDEYVILGFIKIKKTPLINEGCWTNKYDVQRMKLWGITIYKKTPSQTY